MINTKHINPLRKKGGSKIEDTEPDPKPGKAPSPKKKEELTPSHTSSLENERVLTAGTGIKIVDAGPNSTVTVTVDNNIVATLSGSIFQKISGSLQRTAAGDPYIVGQGAVTVSTNSLGQIIISGSGGSGSGAPTTAQYLVLAVDGTLTNERVLTAGGGVTLTDGGAGGAATLGINNAVIATISGSTFTRLSGSLQKTAAGLSYLVAAGAISIVTQSNGQIVISASAGNSTNVGGGDPGAQYLVLAQTASLSNERVFAVGAGLTSVDGGANNSYTLSVDNNVVATVSGTTFTGPVIATAGLSGSLQRLASGETYLVGQGSVTITTASNGQIIISGSGAGSTTNIGGGDPGAQYLVLSTTASLSNERTFTPGTGLVATDAGANSTYTLAINNNVVATISGSTFMLLS